MGDRANIVVYERLAAREAHDARRDEAVFLYSHWGGAGLPEVLRSALQRKMRWEDASYLARIIFCEMVRGYEREETGFGIGVSRPDNDRDFLVVDVTRQVVVQFPERVFNDRGWSALDDLPGVPFERFDGQWHDQTEEVAP